MPAWVVQRYYIPTARELSRLDSVTKSPVLHLFGESVNGMATINAFGERSRFTAMNLDRLDANITGERPSTRTYSCEYPQLCVTWCRSTRVPPLGS